MIMSVWAKNRVFSAYLLVSCHITLLELCQITLGDVTSIQRWRDPLLCNTWDKHLGAFLPKPIFCISAVYQMRHLWLLLGVKTHLPLKPEFIRDLWERRRRQRLLTAPNGPQWGVGRGQLPWPQNLPSLRKSNSHSFLRGNFCNI